jgi:sugar phosphate isomerase/epimerase
MSGHHSRRRAAFLQCGISTACFYPQETADALALLCDSGIGVTEVFLNTFHELGPEYVDRIRGILSAAETRVIALHPFSSMLETFFFASEYRNRLEDGLALYRRFFEICRALEIPLMVFHGDYLQTKFPFERHCENYLLLRKTAREYGVELCQENVVRCKCGRPEYIRRMREYTGDDVSFVLDVKQMRRADIPLEDMLKAMSGRIAHLHLSDGAPGNDCVTPGKGDFPFGTLFRALKAERFEGKMMIELYRGGFSTLAELREAAARMERLYAEGGAEPPVSLGKENPA